MSVIFPYANNYRISDNDFLCAWSHLVASIYPMMVHMNELPRLNSKNPLTTLINSNQQLSVEYLCRMLIPNGYRNTMQATNSFMAANAHIVTSSLVINPVTGKSVNGARLLPAMPNCEHQEIEGLFEADIDDVQTADVRSLSFEQASSKILSSTSFIDTFIDQIERDPYQPMYRNHTHGKPVTGWGERLKIYFWPNPGIGLVKTISSLQPMLVQCQCLAKSVQTKKVWNTVENIASVQVANDIFKWGGVPQDPAKVTWQNVRNVFEAALTGTVPAGTLMNSGWTKVAAFATAHCGNSAQVIWDSRVSTSIIRRLDNIFYQAHLPKIPPAFAGIGLVSGQGGTRKIPPKLKFKWRNGYGRWDAQFIGSAFVQEVCKSLNRKKIGMPIPNGSTGFTSGNWTVRGVEMVLFGDGY